MKYYSNRKKHNRKIRKKAIDDFISICKSANKREQLNKDIAKWCKDNLDMEGMYADDATIKSYHLGKEQGSYAF